MTDGTHRPLGRIAAFSLAGLLALAGGSLGCEQDAGDQMEDAAEEVGEAAEDAADAAEDTAEDAGDEMEDAME